MILILSSARGQLNSVAVLRETRNRYGRMTGDCNLSEQPLHRRYFGWRCGAEGRQVGGDFRKSGHDIRTIHRDHYGRRRAGGDLLDERRQIAGEATGREHGDDGRGAGAGIAYRIGERSARKRRVHNSNLRVRRALVKLADHLLSELGNPALDYNNETRLIRRGQRHDVPLVPQERDATIGDGLRAFGSLRRLEYVADLVEIHQLLLDHTNSNLRGEQAHDAVLDPLAR